MVNVLLVEDDYLDAMNVQRGLNKLKVDYHLEVARNGKEALDKLRSGNMQKEPDLILLDLNMPKMNGLELLKEIRSDRNLSDLRVFIMTTSEEDPDRLAAEKLGISGYIVKPLDFESFNNKGSSIDTFNLLCDLLQKKN